MPSLSRRTFLGAGAAATAAVGVNALPASVLRAAAATASGSGTGSINDIGHVVIFMQENRSFDHYFGKLSGVRGFGDTSLLRFPNGSDVFHQTTSGPSGGSVLQPWHLDTATTNAQRIVDLDHSWSGTHSAWNGGLYNNWIPAKTKTTMGYYARADIPWQYALADAFTVCDQYFCSVQGPTNPNRLYQWSGWIDPNGTGGGPVTDNSEKGYTWTTYPERLQAAGISWKVYQEADNFDDNPLGCSPYSHTRADGKRHHGRCDYDGVRRLRYVLRGERPAVAQNRLDQQSGAATRSDSLGGGRVRRPHHRVGRGLGGVGGH
jgi:phospholipase C